MFRSTVATTQSRRWSRWWRSIAALGAIGGAVLGVGALAAAPAGAADGSAGTCVATINGVDAFSASSPGKAITLQKDEQVAVSGSIATGPVTYVVRMEFAGIGWDVADGSADGNTWSDMLEVNKYTKYGVGLYKVRVNATNGAGDTCDLTTYIKVEGSLMSGTAGKVGVGVLAVGGAALFGSSVAAAFGAKAAAGAGKLVKFGWK